MAQNKRGRPPAEEPMQYPVTVRLKFREREALVAEAKAIGVKLSQVARMRLVQVK